MRLCRCPMKSHVKRSPATACLASSCSTRFSPTSAMPASASTARSAGSTYLTAASSSTASGGAARARRRLGHGRARAREVLAARRTSSTLTRARPRGSAITAWRPLPAPSRRCEWKRSGSQIVHRPGVDDLGRSRALQRAPRGQPRDRPGRPRRRRRRSARAAARRRRRRPRSSRRRPRARRRPRSPARRALPQPRARPRRARASPRARRRARLPPAATSAAVRQSAPCAISGRPGSPVTRASPSGHGRAASR